MSNRNDAGMCDDGSAAAELILCSTGTVSEIDDLAKAATSESLKLANEVFSTRILLREQKL